jgi:hypothetical protein
VSGNPELPSKSDRCAVVYDESVFALEPSTVRVREVGINRNERRAARRERERARQSGQTTPQPGQENEDAPEPEASTSRPPVVPSDVSPARSITDLGETVASATPGGPTLVSTVTAGAAARPTPPPPRPSIGKDQPPFVTFQQLQFIPPVPPTVLASAYLIPPLYTSVVNQSPNPDSVDSSPVLPMNGFEAGLPLLSPISLLANHPARHNGPPGLFFVTRGRTSTGIVDGDGRSVIKKAFTWSDDPAHQMDASTPEHLKTALSINRIEVMTTAQGKTVLVAFALTDIRALEVGHPASLEVIPMEVSKRRAKAPDHSDFMRDIVLLGATSGTSMVAAGDHR